jgi:AraC family transcriptional regulator
LTEAHNREPRIEILPEKKLVGKSMKMSLANNKTFELWQSFMPRRKSVKNTVSTDLYSMQVYDSPLYFKDFNPHTPFTKWATVEVSSFHGISEDLETYRLTGGLYAVFVHKGPPSEFPKTFQLIFGQWLPTSEYALDNREHFERLGDKYKNNDPTSEEEVWVPIKRKENDK